MLILPTGHFVQLYYNPDIQGRCASQFPIEGQGFLQPRGDIRASIVPRNFRVLPTNMQEVVEVHFHREELENRADQERDEDQDMSMDTEAAIMVRRLQVDDPIALASLPQQEPYYDSDDSVLDIDAEFPDLAEWVVEWQVAQRGAASIPSWRSSDFRQLERSCYDRQPDLREVLNQAKQARVTGNIPVQSVVPMSPKAPAFATIRDLDHQSHQQYDQTIAK